MNAMTIWYEPSHSEWYDAGIADSLKMIRDAGFTHVHWNPDAGSSYFYAPSEINHIAELISEAGLRAKSLHAAHGLHHVSERKSPHIDRRKDFTSAVEWRRKAGVDLIVNRIELARRLDTDSVVLHVTIPSSFDDSATREAFLANVCKSFDEIRPVAEKHNVAIAVENLQDRSDHTSMLLERLFDRYPIEFVGWCFDSGHGHSVDNKSMAFLEPFVPRLIITHLHDNYGAKDDHLIPGDGTIRWDEIARMIAGSPAELPLVYETPPDRYSLSRLGFYAAAFRSHTELTAKVEELRATSGQPAAEPS
mgnify:CR=1 FL=1